MVGERERRTTLAGDDGLLHVLHLFGHCGLFVLDSSVLLLYGPKWQLCRRLYLCCVRMRAKPDVLRQLRDDVGLTVCT